MANTKSFETDDETGIETLFCVDPVSKESKSVMKVTEPVKSMQTSTEKAAVFLQSWWRMSSAQKSYREYIRPVHKVTFVVTLIMRILVVSYLCYILASVVDVLYMSNTKNLQIQLDGIGPARTAEILEHSVLRELMTKDSSGNAIIATCR